MHYLKIEVPENILKALNEVVSLAIECHQANMDPEETNVIINPIIMDLDLSDIELKAFVTIFKVTVANHIGAKCPQSPQEVLEASKILSGNMFQAGGIKRGISPGILKNGNLNELTQEILLQEFLEASINPKVNTLIGFFWAFHQLGYGINEVCKEAEGLLNYFAIPDILHEDMCIMGITAMEIEKKLNHYYTLNDIEIATINVKEYYIKLYHKKNGL